MRLRMPRIARPPRGSGVLALVLAVAASAWISHEPVWAALRDHPYFTVTEVDIDGVGPLLTENEVRDWLGVREGASAWDLSPEALRSRLEAHPMIFAAKVVREFPGQLEVTVRERQPEALLVLDKLFYADRTAKVFGPISDVHSRNYPVITGLGGSMPMGRRTSALRRVLRLTRLCERMGCFGGVSEIHVDKHLGPVLYPMAPHVPVVLGWGSWREKIDRAQRAVGAWEGSLDRIASVDVRFHRQVILRMRPTPPSPATAKSRARRRV
jgi:cell division protein FtsQ